MAWFGCGMLQLIGASDDLKVRHAKWHCTWQPTREQSTVLLVPCVLKPAASTHNPTAPPACNSMRDYNAMRLCAQPCETVVLHAARLTRPLHSAPQATRRR